MEHDISWHGQVVKARVLQAGESGFRVPVSCSRPPHPEKGVGTIEKRPS